MELWSLANTMIMGLKRFSQIMGAWSARSEKNSTEVRIPMKIDMSPFVKGPQGDRKLMYELYAVTHHFGGLGGGHYTAYVVGVGGLFLSFFFFTCVTSLPST